MKLTFFGCGDGFSVLQGHNSALIEFAGTSLSIDFPESNHLSLHRMGMKLNEVTNIFVTHLHEDHINGLQKLALYHRVYPAASKPRLFVPTGLLEDLWQCLRHGLEFTSRGKRAFEDYFEIVPVEGSFAIEGVKFELVKTLHVPGMLSYGLLCEPYFYFSGDTVLDEAYLSSVSDCVERIFYECHMQNDVLPSHTSLEEIHTLPAAIQEKTILMHYVDDYLEQAARDEFHAGERVRLAEPLRAYIFENQ